MSISRSKQYNRTLSIAGFDPSGGAGIQADLKTFSVLGCYGTTVLTALPVQNTLGVQCVYDIPLECIVRQFRAVVDDIGTDAVKIGMLNNADIVNAIAELISEYRLSNIVLDPVMVAKSGDALIDDEAVETLKKALIPLATLITPNIPEAERLLGKGISSIDDLADAAQCLSSLGPKAVLIKGGHLQGYDCTDCLLIDNSIHYYKSKRIDTLNTHGTGCTLSSAITSYLACGCSLEDSVRRGKTYLTEALESGSDYTCGKGQGPVNHFYNTWNNSKCIEFRAIQ